MSKEYRVSPATEILYNHRGEGLEVPTYWSAVTNIECPACHQGRVLWDEAGRVPGARRCDGCGQRFQAAGDRVHPLLRSVP